MPALPKMTLVPLLELSVIALLASIIVHFVVADDRVTGEVTVEYLPLRMVQPVAELVMTPTSRPYALTLTMCSWPESDKP